VAAEIATVAADIRRPDRAMPVRPPGVNDRPTDALEVVVAVLDRRRPMPVDDLDHP
jgi:hypothetical protein